MAFSVDELVQRGWERYDDRLSESADSWQLRVDLDESESDRRTLYFVQLHRYDFRSHGAHPLTERWEMSMGFRTMDEALPYVWIRYSVAPNATLELIEEEAHDTWLRLFGQEYG